MPNISLPDPDYFLRAALADGGDPASVKPEAIETRKREIEALLIEGLDSGHAMPMTAEEWQDIRREVRERRAKREP